MTIDKIISQIHQAVLDGDEVTAQDAAQKALSELDGEEGLRIVRDGIQPAMDKIGADFESGEAFLPNLMLAGDAAIAALDILLPSLQGGEFALKGIVVLGTVFGDLHDIGKNITSAILTANGYRVIDLGVNVSARDFIAAAEKEGADIIATSTLLSTCLPYQRELVNLLTDSGRREKFHVICGGGPVTPEWVETIKADGYGREAHDAVKICNQLLSGEYTPGQQPPVIEGALTT